MRAKGLNGEPRDGATIRVLELSSHSRLPEPASPRLRDKVPAGYGVQEQCLPFVAATGLGALIPSPISFGLCAPGEVPAGARAFRSPVEAMLPAEQRDPRVFWVRDDVARGFLGNAFMLRPVDAGPGAEGVPTPGISFFERADQVELCKLHLPYVLHTAQGCDLLFLPPLNRPGSGFQILSGLVETDWYAHPVNLVLRRPPAGSVAVAAGAPIAQAIVLRREDRSTRLEQLAPASEEARRLRGELAGWYARHARHRSAYKAMARSRSAAGSGAAA